MIILYIYLILLESLFESNLLVSPSACDDDFHSKIIHLVKRDAFNVVLNIR